MVRLQARRRPLAGSVVALISLLTFHGCGASPEGPSDQPDPPPAPILPFTGTAPAVEPVAGSAAPSSPSVQPSVVSTPAPPVPAATPAAAPQGVPSPAPIVVEPSEASNLPLLGGTLLVTASGEWAVVSNPERDVVHVVDLEAAQLSRSIELGPGSVPVRLVEDAQGTVHVAQRGSGAISSFDPAVPDALLTRSACRDPRGITYDAFAEELVVVCQSGEVVWFSGLELEPVRRAFVALDLRDVVALETELVVSTFRMAELLYVSREGELLARRRPATVSDQGNGLFEPHVAGRLLGDEGGRLLMHHQRSNVSEAVSTAYGGAEPHCQGGISHNALTVSDEQGETLRSLGVLPNGVFLDLAIAPDGVEFAVLATAPGQTSILQGRLDQEGDSPCDLLAPTVLSVEGNATAVAFTPAGRLLIQHRERATLDIVGVGTVPLGTGLADSPGLNLFHEPTARGIACATCHPEGGEDGTTWPFAREGHRRTQVVARRISRSAPLHWKGNLGDMRELLVDTMVNRMGGTLPSDEAMVQLGEFMDRLPVPLPPRRPDESALAGRDVFASLGCDDCHRGEMYTDNLNHDVGTGGDFQTPSLLGVAYRFPLMHDGCARTLQERFGDCGGDERHGILAELTDEELDQLIAFLETL